MAGERKKIQYQIYRIERELTSIIVVSQSYEQRSLHTPCQPLTVDDWLSVCPLRSGV